MDGFIQCCCNGLDDFAITHGHAACYCPASMLREKSVQTCGSLKLGPHSYVANACPACGYQTCLIVSCFLTFYVFLPPRSDELPADRTAALLG